jgi:hypothetical protein
MMKPLITKKRSTPQALSRNAEAWVATTARAATARNTWMQSSCSCAGTAPWSDGFGMEIPSAPGLEVKALKEIAAMRVDDLAER